ncbi:hypothetical protein GCM10027265_05880 [Jatrophihabitans fulvus]
MIALLACVATAVAGCTSDGGSGPSGSATPPTTAPTSGGASGGASGGGSSSGSSAAGAQYYLSVGDSYAAGYQPASGGGVGTTSTAGFAYQVVAKLKGRLDLTLENLGCSGATTTEVLTRKGCALGTRGLGPGATPYPDRTQAQAAVDFLKAHAGKVRLITVSLGGNDIRTCVAAGSVSAVTSCVSQKLTTIVTNLTKLVGQLRAAAGPSTTIVGVGYPDVFLGEALSKSPQSRQLAELSVIAFRSLINPQLKLAYASAKGEYADVAAATGAFLPTTGTTTLPGYGRVPTRVAKVCELTWYCQYKDIHPKPNGYKIIANTVVPFVL